MNARVKVLCVDDNKDTADSTAMLLQQAGFETRSCHSGREALSVAEGFHPDVCLIDLSMPGMSGDELAAHLRERAEGPLRCIALTGSWDIGAQHLTHNAGFEEHLVKPVEPHRLIAVISAPGVTGPTQGG